MLNKFNDCITLNKKKRQPNTQFSSSAHENTKLILNVNYIPSLYVVTDNNAIEYICTFSNFLVYPILCRRIYSTTMSGKDHQDDLGAFSLP